jgi:uncharacterized oxidoreductase
MPETTSETLLSPAALTAFVSRVLTQTGSSDYEAHTVAEHLVQANLTGHDSHGVGLIPTYVKHIQAGLVKANQPLTLVQDSGNIICIDGGRGYGQRLAKEAMDVALKRAKKLGLVAMTLRNAHHIGRVGTYGEQSLAAGLISLHFVNVTDHKPIVAPFGGSDARFVTNPVCIAIPGETPVLLDMATSAIALGKARVAKNQGVPAPEGAIIDSEGNPSRDPNVMFTEPMGALLPFGGALSGHKGYGLALVCELLAGVLGGGGTIQPTNPQEGGIINSMLTIILEPTRFVDSDFFAHEVAAMIDYAKASPPQDPEKPVMVPGEPEKHHRETRSKGIPLDANTWQEMRAAAVRVGISDTDIDAIIETPS